MGCNKMADETIQKLIDELNGKIEEIKPQLDHIREIYALLEGIQKHTQVSLDLPDLSWLISKAGAPQKEISSPQANSTIRPDRFYGKELTDAAEEYLNMVGHAVPLSEIIDGLTKGGASITGMEKLDTALTRATRKFKKFKRAGLEPNFGLLSWYEKKRKWTRRTGLEVSVEGKDSGQGKDELSGSEQNENKQ
jgi:hypothetical protein